MSEQATPTLALGQTLHAVIDDAGMILGSSTRSIERAVQDIDLAAWSERTGRVFPSSDFRRYRLGEGPMPAGFHFVQLMPLVVPAAADYETGGVDR